MKLLIQFSALSGKQFLSELSHLGAPGVQKLLPFASMLGLAEGAILKMLQVYLKHHIPEVQVDTLHLKKADAELFNAVGLEVRILDYPAFMQRLLPLLKKAAQTEVRLQPVCDVIGIMNERAPGMLAGNIATMGKDTMDEIIITLLMGYNDLLCERLNLLLKQKGLDFSIECVKIKK